MGKIGGQLRSRGPVGTLLVLAVRENEIPGGEAQGAVKDSAFTCALVYGSQSKHQKITGGRKPTGYC